jgi:hypothetical protein
MSKQRFSTQKKRFEKRTTKAPKKEEEECQSNFEQKLN